MLVRVLAPAAAQVQDLGIDDPVVEAGPESLSQGLLVGTLFLLFPFHDQPLKEQSQLPSVAPKALSPSPVSLPDVQSNHSHTFTFPAAPSVPGKHPTRLRASSFGILQAGLFVCFLQRLAEQVLKTQFLNGAMNSFETLSFPT